MFLVNANSPAPSQQYFPGKCTRYCEQHGCQHFANKFKRDDRFSEKWWYRLYRWNVRMLNAIPILNYAEANIAVYFFFYPLLILILLYRLIK